ncbi:MAG TPA: iron-sulfur cluster assembly scaffold protein [Rhizomicrobium sp.]|jgi:nitrogen fixation NifU-like protein|nr:iron-sulfur cluster assembly scaffold protein [Rhizomicrobium sp.]
MSDPLYKKELLRLAADATGSGRLTVPCGTGMAHNQVCGDKVIMDVAIAEGRIAAVAHHTQACVLTQASAAILGAEVTGMNREEVLALHAAVGAMLAGGSAPHAPFDVFVVFDGVAELGSRHKCVLLPIEALLAALDAQDAG